MIVLFRDLKLHLLLLIKLRDIKSLDTSYRDLTLGLLGVYSILISSLLKSIFSSQRRSSRLFVGFLEFSLEYHSPTIGDSKVLINSILLLLTHTKRSLSSRLSKNIAINISQRFILKILYSLTIISSIIVIIKLRRLNTR